MGKLDSYKSKSYAKNFAYFENYKKNNRDPQNEAFKAAYVSQIGQIISPCGTGKTRIQISLHIQDMIRLNKEYESGVFVIASHRLSLNRQLLDQLVDVAVNCGLPFDVLYIGSANCDLSKYYSKYHYLGYKPEVSQHLVSTRSKEIEKFIQNSRDNNKHAIIASTYDSFATLKDIGPINMVTYDEAHNTTQDDFKKNILEVKPSIEKEYFFTATRRIAGDDGGMNDEDFYGKVLFDAFPREMLELGEIAEPKLHLIEGEEGQTTNVTNTDMLVKNTIEAFIQHRKCLKEASCLPEEIGAKLLTGCDGIEEMKRIYNDPSLIKFASDNRLQVFAISSEGSYVNWAKYSREAFFNKLNLLSDKEDAIILNVDILTEGIDLPSITAVMTLRNLGLTKLIQLTGRALRLNRLDRINLYSGKIIPGDHTSYVKPYGYVIIPAHLASANHHEDMCKILELFYSQYETTPDQLMINEKFIDYQPLKLNSMIPVSFNSGKDYNLEHDYFSLIEGATLSIFKKNCANDNEKKEYIESLLAS